MDASARCEDFSVGSWVLAAGLPQQAQNFRAIFAQEINCAPSADSILLRPVQFAMSTHARYHPCVDALAQYLLGSLSLKHSASRKADPQAERGPLSWPSDHASFPF